MSGPARVGGDDDHRRLLEPGADLADAIEPGHSVEVPVHQHAADVGQVHRFQLGRVGVPHDDDLIPHGSEPLVDQGERGFIVVDHDDGRLRAERGGGGHEGFSMAAGGRDALRGCGVRVCHRTDWQRGVWGERFNHAMM